MRFLRGGGLKSSCGYYCELQKQKWMNQDGIFPGLVATDETCGVSMIQVSICTYTHDFVEIPVTHVCKEEKKN